MTRQPLLLTISIVASMMVAACASSPKKNEQLEQTRAELEATKANPEVQKYAPAAVLDAEQALKRAERAHKDDDKAGRRHELYLAERHLDIARTTAERSLAEQQIKDLSEERDRLALAARDLELAEKQSELTARESELEQAEVRTRELEAELAALEAQRTKRGMLLTLDDLFFQTASANIAPGATPTLDKVVEFLTTNSDQHIIIEGHTDSVGEADFNKQLSERRAGAVKDLIVARGIDPDRIVTRGYGESRPVASNANQGGRQLNRRVEIVFPDTAR